MDLRGIITHVYKAHLCFVCIFSTRAHISSPGDTEPINLLKQLSHIYSKNGMEVHT